MICLLKFLVTATMLFTYCNVSSVKFNTSGSQRSRFTWDQTTTENIPEVLMLHNACKNFGNWSNFFRKHKKFVITEKLHCLHIYIKGIIEGWVICIQAKNISTINYQKTANTIFTITRNLFFTIKKSVIYNLLPCVILQISGCPSVAKIQGYV